MEQVPDAALRELVYEEPLERGAWLPQAERRAAAEAEQGRRQAAGLQRGLVSPVVREGQEQQQPVRQVLAQREAVGVPELEAKQYSMEAELAAWQQLEAEQQELARRQREPEERAE